MAEDKKGFILYADMRGNFDKLPNEKAGELIKHIFSYVNDESPEPIDLIIDIAFEPIKNQLKRDLKKWESIRLKRSDAGKASAESRKQKATKSTSVESVEQKPTKSTVKVNVNDNVIVNVIKYLNIKTGKNFKSSSEKTISLINSRIKEGFTLDNFKTVIDVKALEWITNDEMNGYLRPETLFSNKFEGYLNSKPISKPIERQETPLEKAARITEERLNRK